VIGASVLVSQAMIGTPVRLAGLFYWAFSLNVLYAGLATAAGTFAAVSRREVM